MIRHRISINQHDITMIDLTSNVATEPWEKNVLRGFTQGETVFYTDKTSEATVRIYLPDPGLVLSDLEVWGD